LYLFNNVEIKSTLQEDKNKNLYFLIATTQLATGVLAIFRRVTPDNAATHLQ
jgi:hypothetical protein